MSEVSSELALTHVDTMLLQYDVEYIGDRFVYSCMCVYLPY